MTTDPPQGAKKFPVFLLVLTILALAAGILLGRHLTGPTQPPQIDGGTFLQPPKALASFSLVDDAEQPFGLQQVKGRWTFLFFGYTHCPDVCPTTLSLLNLVATQLGAHAGVLDDTRFVFVSVDPERDTPESLGKYVHYFNKDFIGVTGSDDQVANLAHQVGAVYARTKDESPAGGYIVDHSASILLLDKQGNLCAVFSSVPHDANDITDSFLKIREYYEAKRT
jgi:protein SCO1/2